MPGVVTIPSIASGEVPLAWTVKQVSTHDHDRPVKASALLRSWKPFEARGLMHRDHVRIGPGEAHDFHVDEGPGEIVNIWFTFTPYKARDIARYNRPWEARRKLRLRIHFDGAAEPAVDAPVGDFFGVGYGEYKEHVSTYLEMTSGGYVCRFPMPFGKSARVSVVNTSDRKAIGSFYGAVTYKIWNDPAGREGIRPYTFHASHREEDPTTPGIPYKILDARGEGFYVGVVLNIANARRGDGLAFLEGNTKLFVDGGATPSLEYTGTEDLFQGAWYYVNGEFSAPCSALTVRSWAGMGPVRTFLLSKHAINKTSQYRFHDADAIPFSRSMLVHVHHGEFDEVPTVQSSVAYFYARGDVQVNTDTLRAGEFVDEYVAP